MHELSEDKKQLIKDFGKFMTDPTQRVMRVQGAPGVGKTKVIESMVRHYLEKNKLKRVLDPETKEITSSNVVLTATTNKATRVVGEVADALRDEYGDFYVRTIHSFLGLTIRNNYSNGTTFLTRAKKDQIVQLCGETLIFIDEFSYCDDVLKRYIDEDLISNSNTKLVLVADKYQSKPVNSSGLCGFFSDGTPEFTLTERFRYPTGSAIHLNSLNFEKMIETGEKGNPLLFDDTFEVITKEEFMKNHLRKYFINADTDSKYIAYHNGVVVGINNYIHKAKNSANFTGEVPYIIKGQKMISNQTYRGKQWSIFNEEELVVANVGEIKSDHGIQYYPTNFKFLKGIDLKVIANFGKFKYELNKAAKNKDWQRYFYLKENFIDVRHSWAITAHKSQGSTYDYAFVDYNDLITIQTKDEFWRLLNVATTRPRKKVFLIRG